MGAIASQITSLTIVFSTVYFHLDTDQRKQQVRVRVKNRLFDGYASKPRVTGLGAGNSPEAGEFSAQMASNAENVSFGDVIMLFARLTIGDLFY